MSEAVVVGDPVPVAVALLLADGHRAQRHAHLLLDSHVHGVRGADALERDQLVGRSPGGHGRVLDLHGNPVVRELQVVHGVVPFRHGFSRHGERVGSEDEAESLHPREVARAALRALADEVGVDVEVAVGD